MQTITLPFAPLKALCKLAADKDVRYYLNGVAVQVTGREVRIVATDGNALGGYRHELAEDEAVTEPLNVIIPRKAIESFKPAPKLPLVFLQIDAMADGAQTARFMQAGNSTGFVLIDGKFPDWSRVIPQKISGETGYFDPELIYRFTQCGRILQANPKAVHLSLGHNGEGAAWVNLANPNFFGVVMPWHEPAPSALPDWLSTSPKEVKKAA